METKTSSKVKPFLLNLLGAFVAYVVWSVTFEIISPILNYLLPMPIIGSLLAYPRGTMIAGAIVLNGAPILIASFVATKITKNATYCFANKAFCIYIILISVYSMALNTTFIAELCSIVCAVISIYSFESEAHV